MIQNKGLNALLKQRGFETPVQWFDPGFGFSERMSNLSYTSLYRQHHFPVYYLEDHENIRSLGDAMLHDLLEQRRLRHLENDFEPIIIDHLNRII